LFMLSVANKPIMLCVIMLNVIMLSVVAPCECQPCHELKVREERMNDSLKDCIHKNIL
jgi:hypothetical protein